MALNTSGSNSLYWKTGLNTKGISAGANATKGILRGLMGSISRMDIFAAIGIGAALAFKKIIKSAYKFSLEFEHAMKEVQTISDSVKNNFAGISDAVMELSTEVPDSATKLTKALYQIVSAGYDGADAFDILSTSARLAVATVTDTFVAADVLTYVMNAYGKAAGTAAEISDKLFTIIKLGKVKMEQLAPSLSMVTGLAAEAGMSFNDLVSFYAEAVKKIQPHIVSTGIRGFLTALLRASKEGAEAAKAAKDMGIEFDIVTLKTKGLEYMLRQMSDATEGQKQKLMELFPNVRGLIGLLAAMTNEGQNFKETSDKIADSAGNMQEAFGIMVQDTTNQMSILKNNITKKMKPLGDFIVKVTNNIATALNKMFEDPKQLSNFNILINRYYRLSGITNKSASEQLLYNETIRDLIKLSPEHLSVLEDEETSYNDIKDAIYNARTELVKFAKAMAIYDKSKELAENLANLQIAYEDISIELDKYAKSYALATATSINQIEERSELEKELISLQRDLISMNITEKEFDLLSRLARNKISQIDLQKKLNEYLERYEDEIEVIGKKHTKMQKEITDDTIISIKTYDKWLSQLKEADKKIMELGRQKVMTEIGVDIKTASLEQLQTILDNIDDEEVEIAVKMRIEDIEKTLKEGVEKLDPEPIELIKPISLYDETDFNNLFTKLETMKSLGISVSEDLTNAWEYYIEYIAKEYTKDSDNYRIAIEQKKQAEKDFREWQEQQIINQTELSRVMYDSMANAFSQFATETILENKKITDALGDLWKNFADSVIRELLRIEAQKAALAIISLATGGMKGIFDWMKSLIGPDVIGAKGINNLIVPPGYENDTFRIGASSGELINIVPKSEVNNVSNVSNLIQNNQPVPMANMSTQNVYNNFDSGSIVKGLSDLKSSFDAKEMSISVQNYMTGKFSRRDLAFIVKEGQKILKSTSL